MQIKKLFAISALSGLALGANSKYFLNNGTRENGYLVDWAEVLRY